MIPKIGDWNIPHLGAIWNLSQIEKYLKLCEGLDKFEWVDGDIWEKVSVHRQRRMYCPIEKQSYEIDQVYISVRNTRTNERYYGCAVQFFPNNA